MKAFTLLQNFVNTFYILQVADVFFAVWYMSLECRIHLL